MEFAFSPSKPYLQSKSAKTFGNQSSWFGRTLYVAEGTGGLSIWDLFAEGKLTSKGIYDAGGQRVLYIAVPSPGKYALLEVGSAQLQIVDVADPGEPNLALKDVQHGLFYGYQALDHLVEGKCVGAFWHVSGLHGDALSKRGGLKTIVPAFWPIPLIQQSMVNEQLLLDLSECLRPFVMSSVSFSETLVLGQVTTKLHRS